MAVDEDNGGEGEPPRIRTGRVGRTAGVGGMVARQGLGWAGRRSLDIEPLEQVDLRRSDTASSWS